MLQSQFEMTYLSIYKILIIIVAILATFSQARRLTDFKEDVIIPKIYKIIEKNNRIIVQQTAKEEFDKKGLLDFLQNNANLEYRVDNILNRQSEKAAGAKKRLIKRIVAHDKKTPNVVFDRAAGIFFKPLVRLHKTKRIGLDNARNIPMMHGIQNALTALRASFDLERVRASMPRENGYTHEARHLIRILREIDTIIGELGLPYLSGKLHQMFENSYEKKILAPVQELHREIIHIVEAETHKLLRGGAPKVEDLDNVEDTTNNETTTVSVVADSGFTVVPDDPEEPEEKPCPLYPHLPLWNHWTYSQKLYYDECPPGQIRIGTICSKIPNHRLK